MIRQKLGIDVLKVDMLFPETWKRIPYESKYLFKQNSCAELSALRLFTVMFAGQRHTNKNTLRPIVRTGIKSADAIFASCWKDSWQTTTLKRFMSKADTTATRHAS